MVTARVAWKLRAYRPRLRLAALVVIVAYVAQILVGAAVIWGGFSPEIKAAHLSAATLVWMALVYMAAVAYVPKGFDAGRVDRDTTKISRLEGLRH